MDRKWGLGDAKIIPFRRRPEVPQEDPLAAARGCLVAFIIMVPIWVGAALLVWRLTR